MDFSRGLRSWEVKVQYLIRGIYSAYSAWLLVHLPSCGCSHGQVVGMLTHAHSYVLGNLDVRGLCPHQRFYPLDQKEQFSFSGTLPLLC